ncbi:MAG: hypothetical protein GY769_11740 [bacterium]|nr:hypothetical protein [bacterium]
MTGSRKLTLRCPDCESRLVIDRETGEVLFHKPKKAAPAGGQDFDQLLEKLDEDRVHAEDLFEREVSALKNRDRLLEDKFEEALREARESPEDEPPPRPFDLD